MRFLPLIFIGTSYTLGPMGPGLSNQVKLLFADLTDVTLADEDANPISTDNANRAFQGK